MRVMKNDLKQHTQKAFQNTFFLSGASYRQGDILIQKPI